MNERNTWFCDARAFKFGERFKFGFGGRQLERLAQTDFLRHGGVNQFIQIFETEWTRAFRPLQRHSARCDDGQIDRDARVCRSRQAIDFVSKVHSRIQSKPSVENKVHGWKKRVGFGAADACGTL